MTETHEIRQPSLGSSVRQDDPVAGILTFIIADLIVFSFLFLGFMIDRGAQVSLFNESSLELSLPFGIVNTLFLVTSGLFIVYAVKAARRGDAGAFRKWVLMSGAVGLGFGVSKVMEWGQKISQDINMLTNDFYMYYFALTGAHFLHFLAGMGALVFVWYVSFKKPVNGEFYSKIESTAIYWHMVDLLWMLIFPLLYLAAI